MKKGDILGILFFSSLWGASEAVLGGWLYRAGVPHSSVLLTIIGFCILTVCRVYIPRKGTSTIVAGIAMLYKFLNAPFFACHLLGILLLGICYDLFFNVLRIKNKSVCAAAAAYSGYILFALMITYVFRYEHWVEGGIAKVMNHILISGTLAALGCAIAVPASDAFGVWLQTRKTHIPEAAGVFVRVTLVFVTVGMWLFPLSAFLKHYGG
jgi:hypothetical protein